MTLSAQAQPAQTDAALERILRLARRLLGISWVWLSGPDGEVLAGARPLEPALEPNGAALYSLEHQEWGKLAQLGLSDHPSPLSDALEEDIRDLCALLLEVLVQRQEHLWSASTLEHAPQPAFAVDLGGRVRRFNPAALHLFRLNTEEVMGQLFERIPALSSPLLNVVYSQALSGQEVRPLELPCFRSDGTVVLLRFSLAPLLDARGRIRGVVFCADDLLASLEDSNEREALRRLYAGVLDHLPLELTLMDSEERIIYLTPAMVPDPKVRRSVQGLHREQVSRTLGRSEEQLEDWKGRFEAVRRSHKAVQWEETAADTQGLRSMLRCIQPVLSAQGEIEMFIGYSLDLTEQKQAQLEREQALQLYQSLFDNATEGIYQSTPQGTMLRANPALVRFNGYQTEAELLEAVQDIAVEWYVEVGRREEFMRQLEVHGQVTLFESEVYCHKTGERVWISESARAVRGESGQVLYFEGTVQDITARKEAELEREEAALVYKQLFENIPHPIYRSTPDGRMIASNPALVRFNGYNSEAEQIAAVQVGMGKWYVDPSRYSLFRDLLERNGEVHSLESEVYRHRSGERTWVSESAWAVRDDSGRVLYYEGIVQDMSARKEAELEREQALSMYRSLFENATEGIYQTDVDGQMVRANPALVRANNGQSEAELLEQVRLHGEQWYALPGRREEFRALLAQFGRVDALESEVIPYGSSERRWVSESAWSVFDDSGHFLYYEGFVQDITARKGAEVQLEAEKRLLEGVVKTSPNPIFLRTATAQMVLVNPAMLALNQQTEEEFYSGQGQIHPNNPAEFAQWLENDRIMLERGEVMIFEERFTLLSGEVKVYSTVKAPFRRRWRGAGFGHQQRRYRVAAW